MTNDYYDAMEDFNLLSEGEQVSLWSEFCRDKGSYEDEVFYNDDYCFAFA